MTRVTYKGKVYARPFWPGDRVNVPSGAKCHYYSADEGGEIDVTDTDIKGANNPLTELDQVTLDTTTSGQTGAKVLVMGQVNALIDFGGMEQDIIAISDLSPA